MCKCASENIQLKSALEACKKSFFEQTMEFGEHAQHTAWLAFNKGSVNFNMSIENIDFWTKTEKGIDFNSVIVRSLETAEHEQIKRDLLAHGFYADYVENANNWYGYDTIKNVIFYDLVAGAHSVKNYYIYGGLGTGKTTLLTNIAYMLLRYFDVWCQFVTMPQLLKQITAIDVHEAREVHFKKEAGILFVDDIGLEKYTTDNQEACMRDFFTYRYSNNLVTIFAGNIDIKDSKHGIFYKQLNDYMNDTKKFQLIKLQGNSNRK